MKIRLILLGFCITSCTPVIHKESPTFETLFYGQVLSRKEVVLDANESMAKRVAIGLLSGGIVGAIGTANTEEGFSEPKAFEYILSTREAEQEKIVSRSIVDVSSCVEVISPDQSEIDLLIKVDSKKCDHNDG